MTEAMLNTLPQHELRNMAKRAGILIGKSKRITISNLVCAIACGKLHFKSLSTITMPDTSTEINSLTQPHGKTLFIKVFRSCETTT